MMATIQYNSGSACTDSYGAWGGTGFIKCDSAATNAIEMDAWVET